MFTKTVIVHSESNPKNHFLLQYVIGVKILLDIAGISNDFFDINILQYVCNGFF